MIQTAEVGKADKSADDSSVQKECGNIVCFADNTQNVETRK
jgi:hypothetical protein